MTRRAYCKPVVTKRERLSEVAAQATISKGQGTEE